MSDQSQPASPSQPTSTFFTFKVSAPGLDKPQTMVLSGITPISQVKENIAALAKLPIEQIEIHVGERNINADKKHDQVTISEYFRSSTLDKDNNIEARVVKLSTALLNAAPTPTVPDQSSSDSTEPKKGKDRSFMEKHANALATAAVFTWRATLLYGVAVAANIAAGYVFGDSAAKGVLAAGPPSIPYSAIFAIAFIALSLAAVAVYCNLPDENTSKDLTAGTESTSGMQYH